MRRRLRRILIISRLLSTNHELTNSLVCLLAVRKNAIKLFSKRNSIYGLPELILRWWAIVLRNEGRVHFEGFALFVIDLMQALISASPSLSIRHSEDVIRSHST